MFTIPGYNASGPDFEPFTIGDTSKQVIAPADIILTASALDSRVKYAGPSHSYLASDGTLKTSSANEWPLEYRAGVPVGRHEPEKAATNYVPSVEYGNIGPAGATAYDWNYGTTVPTVQSSDMGIAAATSTKTGSLTAVYSEATGTFIAAAAEGGSPTEWMRIKRQFTNAGTAILRWYVARVSGTDYLLARCPAVPAGSYTASVFRKVTSDGLLSAGAQLEEGSFSTSPIITGGNRAASTLEISKDGDAKGITVYFSSGLSVDYDFGQSDKISIPASSVDWATRYLTKISYRI